MPVETVVQRQVWLGSFGYSGHFVLPLDNELLMETENAFFILRFQSVNEIAIAVDSA